MKDETQRPQIWWLPLARRVFGWGAALSLVWGFFISMFLLLPLSALSSWSQTSLGSDWVGWLALRTMNLAPFVPYMCGFVLGAASGFFAPPSEPKNPLRSWFARDVAIDTLLFCLLFNFFFILTTTIVLQFVQLKSVARAFPLIEAVFIALFLFGLCWAIRRARARQHAALRL